MSICRLKDFLNEFYIRDDELREMHNRFCKEIRKGLVEKTNADADTKCYPTFVQDLPTGDEHGKFLALDLGGSRFRVLMVDLQGNHEAKLDSDIYDLTDALITGPGTQLFDHIASCLSDFLMKRSVKEPNLPLGFTFSFPCTQMGLSKALLVRWTKGFSCPGVVNQDVGRMLREAIFRRKDLRIDMVAVLNDTTGTLMSCAHRNPQCRIGLIVGTGCNACYVERVENVEKLGDCYRSKPYVIINVEWGAFGERGALDFIRTEYDEIIDRDSINRGTQILEKMVAGMYLGELVRLIVKRSIRENLIFTTHKELRKITDVVTNQKNCIPTHSLSDVAKDNPPLYIETRKIITQLFQLMEPISDDDCEKFKFICDVVSKRAGMLVGVGLAGLLNKMSLPYAVIAVDGSVYRCHGHFDQYMRESIDKLVDKKYKYDVMLSEDGSGRGAALVAAVVSKEARKSLT